MTLVRFIGMFFMILLGWALAGVVMFSIAHWVRQRYGYLAEPLEDEDFDALDRGV